MCEPSTGLHVIVFKELIKLRVHSLEIKGQMNKNFDIRSLASLKQLNTKTDHYKVYSPKNFAS